MIIDFIHKLVGNTYFIDGKEINCSDQTSLYQTMASEDHGWKRLVSRKTWLKALDSYTKYPEAQIIYSGRYVNLTSKQTVQMAVQDFAQAGIGTPEINELVKNCGGFVLQIMKDKKCSFHEACDVSLMRIKNAITQSCYTYKPDDQSWQTAEYWQFPIETLKLRTGDCDDYTLLHFVACRTAGIPEMFLRCVCGFTYSGEGHATLSYLASDVKWRHCNSTTPYTDSTLALSLPEFGTPEPSNLGLKEVWFSWTDQKSFHKFVTDDARSAFNQIHQKRGEILDNINIRLQTNRNNEGKS